MSDKQIQKLIRSIQTEGKLKMRTNKQLASLAVDHIWATMPMGSPQSELISVIIDRLEATKDGE